MKLVKTPLKKIDPSAQHQAVLIEIKEALRRHENLGPMALLAIASQLVGQLIAVQDQMKFTPQMALDVVMENIIVGNETALDPLLNHTRGSA